MRTVVVRGGKELELVQEDQHFSAHYQVSIRRAQFTQRNSGAGIYPLCIASYRLERRRTAPEMNCFVGFSPPLATCVEYYKKILGWSVVYLLRTMSSIIYDMGKGTGHAVV